MSNTMASALPGSFSTATGTITTSTIGPYTISPSFADLSVSSNSNNAALTVDGQLELKGEKADVVINGVSLSDTLKDIQERLNILVVNQKLEAEWDQLKELGEKYRQLEAELTEKQRMWEIIKK